MRARTLTILAALAAVYLAVAYFGEYLLYFVAARSTTTGRPVSELVRSPLLDTAGRAVYSLVEADGRPLAELHDVHGCVLPLTALVVLRTDRAQWSGTAWRQADTASSKCAARKPKPRTPGVFGEGRFAQRGDTLRLFLWAAGSSQPDTVATATLARDTLRVRIDSAGGGAFVYVRQATQ